MDGQNNAVFSEVFLEMAFRALVLNGATEQEKKQFKVITMVCEKHDISVRKFITAINEVTTELSKLNAEGEV